MSGAVEPARSWDITWQPAAGPMPDGPVQLWVVVFDAAGRFMGAEATTPFPRWRWRRGLLAMDYSPVRVVMANGGWYHTGFLVAVNPEARTWRAMFALSLGEPRELRAGDDITISDGVIAITPEPGALRPPGLPSGPWAPTPHPAIRSASWSASCATCWPRCSARPAGSCRSSPRTPAR